MSADQAAEATYLGARLEKIGIGIERIADVLEKEDVEEHRDTTNLALFGLAQGCANALESMLDDGSMNLLDKSIGLRELVRQWKSMAEVYRKEQEKIDNGQ